MGTWVPCVAILCFIVSLQCEVYGVHSPINHEEFVANKLAQNEDLSRETPPARKPGPHYRLPMTAVPFKYDINLETNIPTSDDFSGRVKISVTAVQAVPYLVLHADHKVLLDIKPADVVVNSAADNVNLVYRLDKDDTLQFLTVHLRTPMTLGTTYFLTINFNGKLKNDMTGFYRSSYTTTTGEEKVLAATQFEPVHARSAFPCWDEPHYKASFKMTITHSSKLHALFNTMNVTRTEANGKVTSEFAETSPMSTYLVAFIISDFGSEEKTTNTNLLFRVWMRSEHVDQAVEANRVGIAALEKLEEYTDIDFKSHGFNKLDLIAIPDFQAGAMENWGLITFRETGLMYVKNETTDSSRQSIALVVAHEEAHMWFGDLVSPAWWSYTWLNEGFARYFQYLSINEVHPDWRLMDVFVVQTIQSALNSDSLATSQAMTSEVYSPVEVRGKFDSISYDKGASILHMTRNVIGEDLFRTALREYLIKKKFSVATPNDLFEAFSVGFSFPNATIYDILDTWTTQPGYPLITVSIDNEGKATLNQERYISIKKDNIESTSLWWVPFTFTTAKNPDFSTKNIVWLEPKKTQTIALTSDNTKPAWVICNVNEAGFYRVNYDEGNWKAISDQLVKDFTKISVLNRAQIIDDSMMLARSGHAKYQVSLDATKYLSSENDSIPWIAALNQFNYIERMLQSSDVFDNYKNYMLEKTKEIYNQLGREEKESDPHVTKIFRANIVGKVCSLNEDDCVNWAQEMFRKLKENNESVPPNLRSTVYCTALRYSSPGDWDFLWKRYGETVVAGERVVILGSLGCSNDTEVLKKYLAMSVTESSGVRKQDAQTVFSSVLNGSPKNFDVAYDFFKNNFTQITASYGGMTGLESVVNALANRITTEDKANEMEKFLNENFERLGMTQTAVTRAVEISKGNLAWRQQHFQEVSGWFKNGAVSFRSATLWIVISCSLFTIWRQ